MSDDLPDKFDTRGPIAPTLGNPVRVRRVNGVLVEEPILRKRATRYGGDAIVDGLRDLEFDVYGGGGKRTGFADYASSQRGETRDEFDAFGGDGGGRSGFADYAARQRTAGTGAGPDDDYEPGDFRSDGYDIGSSGGGGAGISQTAYQDGDLDSDLFGQPSPPARERPRAELKDPASDGSDSRYRDPGYDSGRDLANDLLDQERGPPRRSREDSTFASRKWGR